MTLLRIGVLGMLVATSLALTVGFPGTFTSPDENANFQFATSVARGDGLCLRDDALAFADGIVHPRSTIVLGACIVPGSFIGLPILAGTLGVIFGTWGTLLLTPVLALLAIVCGWDLVRRLTRDESFADLATVFAFTHPAWLAYSGRVMMHNVAFVACLVIGAWFAFVALPGHRRLAVFASGVAVGTALMLRVFELPWVLALAVVAMILLRKRTSWRMTLIWFLGFGVMLALMAGWNALTYGSPFASGYLVDVPDASAAPSVSAATTQSWSAPAWLGYFFPFGIDFTAIVKNSWWYGISLFPWATALAVVGWVIAMTDKNATPATKVTKCVAWITLGLTVWLDLVYGSWTFADNPDPKAITLGNSHVRYWLPLFVLGGWLSALAVRRSYGWILGRSRRWALVFLAVAVIAWAGASSFVVLVKPDGILPTRAALASFEVKRAAIVSSTEPNAVIVVDRADKYVFPSRSVVVPLRSDATFAAMPELAAAQPLYYFGITLPESDVAHLNDIVLAQLDLRIEHVLTINEESLYRISLLDL